MIDIPLISMIYILHCCYASHFSFVRVETLNLTIQFWFNFSIDLVVKNTNCYV